jgi:hypothetical protein
MWLLGQRCGKTWWLKRDDRDNWVPVTEEENATNKKYWNDTFDEICAKVFNDAFNKEPSK